MANKLRLGIPKGLSLIHISDLDKIAHKIVNSSRASKDLKGLITTFSANDPQELVTIDREKAKTMNIPVSYTHLKSTTRLCRSWRGAARSAARTSANYGGSARPI